MVGVLIGLRMGAARKVTRLSGIGLSGGWGLKVAEVRAEL